MLKLLDKIFEREFEISSTEKYLFILKLTCLVHFTLIPIFFYLHVWILFMFNIASVILYYILLKTISKDRLLLTFFCAYIEIVLHTLLSIILIGNDFGFQLYIPSIIPLLFYVVFSIDQYGHLKYPIIYSVVSLLFFTAANIYNYYFEPVYQNINKNIKLGLFLYNSFIVFTMLILFSLLFILQIRGSIRNIELQRQKLASVANTDPLTGLLNRRKFMEDIQDLIKSNKNFTILLSDIDDFKKINDTYGHDCGDQMLINVTSQFKALVTNPNLVCRWGGEEIIVLYSGTFEEGIAFGELLRATVANSSICYNDKNLSATITTGVAFFDGRESLDSVIVRADKALYKGKQNGKNQVRTV